MAQENRNFIDSYIQNRLDSGAVDVKDYDRAFAQAINDPKSVVSYLNGGYDQGVRRIISGLSSGTDEGLMAAKAAYEDLNTTISDNTEAFSSVLSHPGGKTSKLIATYQERASRALSHEYNQQQITLPDGTSTTIGQYFQNPGQFTRSFNRKGHASEVYDAYMNGEDPLLTRMLAPCMDPAFNNAAGKAPNVDHLQNTNGALAIYNHRDLLKETFGVGADFFTDRLHSDLSSIGGYDKAIPALCKYASGKAARTDLSGSSLAASVMDDFHTMFTRLAESAAPTQGGKPAELSPDSRSLLAATTVKAIEMMSNSGQSFDVSDPLKTSAMVTCMSARARAKAAGYGDIFDGADSSSLFADHVAKAGTYEQNQSLIAQWAGSDGTPGLELKLLSLCTGGADFLTEKQSNSTSVARWGSVRASASGVSSAPALDTLASRMMHDLGYKYFLPQMKQNKSAEEIRQSIATDIPMTEEILAHLSNTIVDFGVTDPGAQQFIASMALGAVTQGTPVNLESALHSAITRKSNLPTSTVQALRQFYMATVAAPKQFREERGEAKSWLMSPIGYGLTETAAETLLASTDTEVAGMISQGAALGVQVDPTQHYRSIFNSGYVYKTDENTKLITPVWTNSMDQEILAAHPELTGTTPTIRRSLYSAELSQSRQAYLQQVADIRAAKRAHDTTVSREEARNEAAMNGL